MRRTLTHFMTGVIGCALFFCLAETSVCRQETAEQFVDRVKKAIADDEWGRASNGIKHALTLNPNLPSALFLAAQVYWHEGARSRAVDSLNQAVEIQPVYPEAHLLFAQFLKDTNKLERAKEEASIAINQGATRLPAYRLLAEIDLARGDFDAAIASLETALNPMSVPSEDAKHTTEQIDQSRELAEKLKRVSVFAARQEAPDIVRPFLLNNPQPRHPEEARRLKIQGTVLMGVLVTENGDVDLVIVLRGLWPGLDEEAKNVARQLRFSPATNGIKPIPYWTKLSVAFILK